MLTRALSILSKFKTNQDPHKTTNRDIIDMTSSIKLHHTLPTSVTYFTSSTRLAKSLLDCSNHKLWVDSHLEDQQK